MTACMPMEQSDTSVPEKVVVPVEVCVRASSSTPFTDIQSHVTRFLHATKSWYNSPGRIVGAQIDLDPILAHNLEHLTVCSTGQPMDALFMWQVQPEIFIYRLNEDGPAEDDEVEDGVPSFAEWELPSRDFDGVWESLVFETDIQRRLLSFAATSMLFSQHGVSPALIAWNKVVLLHGPPGTGKTSLCKALAQKLSIRLQSSFRLGHLIEVNAHSLFSKWFSESGKLVSALFSKISDFVDEPTELVFVLIDEVESLTAARKGAAAGTEPSDAIRAVNALLTHLDALRSKANVMIMCTSNLPEAVDVAFVDRADIKAYVGPPGMRARYEILRSSVLELLRVGILDHTKGTFRGWEVLWPEPNFSVPSMDACQLTDNASSPDDASRRLSERLRDVASACDGFSGRALRKLPFLAHAHMGAKLGCCCESFLTALAQVAQIESSDRAMLLSS